MLSAIKRFVHFSLAKIGYRLVAIDGTPGTNDALSLFFTFLKGQGFDPRHVIDVGANRGNWTRTAIRYFPHARYTLVEPQDFLKEHIKDLIGGGYKIKWINAGASDAAGQMTFTLANRDDSSTFMFSEDEAKKAGFRQVVIEVKTLNDIVKSEGLPANMVKIDAEGLDLRVLAGASELFGRTEIFLVEVNIRDAHYENTLARVMEFMNQREYQLMEITDTNRSPKYGLLWLCEIAFLKNGSKLLDTVTGYE